MGSEPVFFEQRTVNNLQVQRVWGSWKNLRRDLGEASASAACRRRQTLNKLSAAKQTTATPWQISSSYNFAPIFLKSVFLNGEVKFEASWLSARGKIGALPSEDCRSPAVAEAEIASCCWGAAAPRGSHCSFGSSRRKGWKCSGSGASLGCCWTGRLQKIRSKWKWGQVGRFFLQRNSTDNVEAPSKGSPGGI